MLVQFRTRRSRRSRDACLVDRVDDRGACRRILADYVEKGPRTASRVKVPDTPNKRATLRLLGKKQCPHQMVTAGCGSARGASIAARGEIVRRWWHRAVGCIGRSLGPGCSHDRPWPAAAGLTAHGRHGQRIRSPATGLPTWSTCPDSPRRIAFPCRACSARQ